MKFLKASNLYYLNRITYIKLRWIAYIGQITTIIFVQFYLNFKFNYFICISIILISVLTNLYLQFRVKENQLNNFFSTIYLSLDIIQLGILFFFNGRYNQSVYIFNYSPICIFFTIFLNLFLVPIYFIPFLIIFAQ